MSEQLSLFDLTLNTVRVEPTRAEARKLNAELKRCRRQWRDVRHSLPTGLQCVEGCDHNATVCVVQPYLDRLREPLTRRAEEINARLAGTWVVV